MNFSHLCPLQTPPCTIFRQATLVFLAFEQLNQIANEGGEIINGLICLVWFCLSSLFSENNPDNLSSRKKKEKQKTNRTIIVFVNQIYSFSLARWRPVVIRVAVFTIPQSIPSPYPSPAPSRFPRPDQPTYTPPRDSGAVGAAPQGRTRMGQKLEPLYRHQYKLCLVIRKAVICSLWLKAKAVSNRRPIWEPKPKMSLQHNTYSLQQSIHTENLFWISGEA